jgi:CrcB protein
VRLLLVCLGGALGSGARYLVAVALVPRLSSASPGVGLALTFPWATLTVNVVGCFLLELLVGLVAGGLRLSTELRLLLATGVLGGFTTYSSFNTETAALWRAGAPRLAVIYLLVTLLACLLSGLLGAQLARLLTVAAPQV